jgi:hypothetical protein
MNNHTGISVPESGTKYCGGDVKMNDLRGGGFSMSKTTLVNLIFRLKGNR